MRLANSNSSTSRDGKTFPSSLRMVNSSSSFRKLSNKSVGHSKYSSRFVIWNIVICVHFSIYCKLTATQQWFAFVHAVGLITVESCRYNSLSVLCIENDFNSTIYSRNVLRCLWDDIICYKPFSMGFWQIAITGLWATFGHLYTYTFQMPLLQGPL